MNLLLLAIQRGGAVFEVRLEQATQDDLAAKFAAFEKQFLDTETEIHDYEPGFRPDVGGVVGLKFDLPEPLWRCRSSLPNDVSAIDKKGLKSSPPVALVALDTGRQPRFRFQAVDNRNILQEKRAVIFNPKGFKSNDEIGIIVGGHIDAVHADGYLYFKSEHTVRRFLDLGNHFREATDEEIRGLLGNGLFVVDKWEPVLSAATTPLRLKIHAVRTNGQPLTVAAIQKVARRLGKPVKMKQGLIVVPSTPAEFRDFVRIISDDYLESGLEPSTMYLANSKRRVGGPKRTGQPNSP